MPGKTASVRCVVSVLDLQRVLCARGYELECDGIAGPQTENAYVCWATDSCSFVLVPAPTLPFSMVAIDLRGALALGLPCPHLEALPLAPPAAKWCPDCGALLAASEWRVPRAIGGEP